MSLPPCPQCQSEYTYEDGSQYICPECAFEWTENDGEAAEETLSVKDVQRRRVARRRHRRPD